MDVFKCNAALQVRLKQSLSEACRGRNQATRDKFSHSVGYYLLINHFQALAVEHNVEKVAEMQFSRDRFVILLAWLDQYDMVKMCIARGCFPLRPVSVGSHLTRGPIKSLQIKNLKIDETESSKDTKTNEDPQLFSWH